MRRPTPWIVVVLVLAICPPVSGRECRWPEVNKQGFRPHSVIAYAVGPSPGGRPFPTEHEPCVDRAFAAWTAANGQSGLQVRFVRGTGGVIVQFDRPGGLALRQGKGGAWSDGVRGADGYLERAVIWITGERRLIDTCEGITKVLLHELGHLHGLRDTAAYHGPSVMNRAARRDDAGGRIPLAPSRCDALQAREASGGTSRADGRLMAYR